MGPIILVGRQIPARAWSFAKEPSFYWQAANLRRRALINSRALGAIIFNLPGRRNVERRLFVRAGLNLFFNVCPTSLGSTSLDFLESCGRTTAQAGSGEAGQEHLAEQARLNLGLFAA